MSIDLTTSYIGITALIIFVLAYLVVMIEEFSHLRKSKPVIISAALIWGLIGFYYSNLSIDSSVVEHALEHNILEFAELFLFLLVAMTYINTLEERKVFDVVRFQLTSRGYSFRKLFIFTGIITFIISPTIRSVLPYVSIFKVKLLTLSTYLALELCNHFSALL